MNYRNNDYAIYDNIYWFDGFVNKLDIRNYTIEGDICNSRFVSFTTPNFQSISNYSELTDLANEVYNKNWSPEEYASAYQDQVDLINAFQSGDINSFDAASLGAALGADLQDAAEVIAAASSAGVTVDLEAAAEGAGFDSFASAVAAYNAQYGTSYTVDEAKAALGQ